MTDTFDADAAGTGAADPAETGGPPSIDTGRWAASDPLLAQLWESPNRAGLLHPDVARITLEISADALAAMVADGHLDAVVVAGEHWVRADQVWAHHAEMVTARVTDRAARLAGMRELLRDYLARCPVVADYRSAVAAGAPLLTARRGSRHGTRGLHLHSVAFPVRALEQWRTANAARRPEFHEIPVGPVFAEALTDLEGVAERGNVRAFAAAPAEGSRRVRNWVAVDPTVWAVELPDELRRDAL